MNQKVEAETVETTVIEEDTKGIFKSWWNSPSKKKDVVIQTAMILGSMVIAGTTGISI